MTKIVHFFFRNNRVVSIAMCVFMLALLASAFVMEHVFLLEPCPLCWVQRGVVVMLALLFFFHAFFYQTSLQNLFASVTIILGSVLGVVVAARHVWLQHLPEGLIPECMPSVEYLLRTLPVFDVVTKIFKGSAECSEVSWTFFGLSIPEQMLLVFLLSFLVGLLKLVSALNFNKLMRGYAPND